MVLAFKFIRAGSRFRYEWETQRFEIRAFPSFRTLYFVFSSEQLLRNIFVQNESRLFFQDPHFVFISDGNSFFRVFVANIQPEKEEEIKKNLFLI